MVFILKPYLLSSHKSAFRFFCRQSLLFLKGVLLMRNVVFHRVVVFENGDRCLRRRRSVSSSFDFATVRRRHQNAKIDRIAVASVSRSWTSRTSVSVPLRDLDPSEDNSRSFSEYISDGSRILAVTFPDETRRERMTDTTWKVQVLC